MTRARRALAAVAVCAGFVAPGVAQHASSQPSRSAPPFGDPASAVEPLAPLRAALGADDEAAARRSLAEALSPKEGRVEVLSASLAVCEEAGRVGVWLAAVEAAAAADPTDAAPWYFLGFVLQRVKLLARADAALAKAAAADPASPEIRAAYAWNAWLRFDRDAAEARAALGDFPDKARLLAALRPPASEK
ncbi:MAG TPA: hypothetical protein VEI02_15875, partial [Planctomycetota bacterium]|nr:hypothetical protein [Planctomycetota bacterium]